MADFIEVTKIIERTDGYEDEVKIWISKYHLTSIEQDEHHNQTYLIYNGEEIKVRDTVSEILEGFSN